MSTKWSFTPAHKRFGFSLMNLYYNCKNAIYTQIMLAPRFLLVREREGKHSIIILTLVPDLKGARCQYGF